MDRKYTSADLTVLDLRTAILKRPGIYFGEHPIGEWPLAMLAMTLDVPGAQRRDMAITGRKVSVHRDGTYEVVIEIDRFEWVRSDATPKAIDNLRARSWWRELCTRYELSAELTSEVDSPESGLPLVLSTGTFRVDAAPDPAICPNRERWWDDWRSRLVLLYGTFGLPGEPIQVLTTDEHGSIEIKLYCDG